MHTAHPQRPPRTHAHTPCTTARSDRRLRASCTGGIPCAATSSRTTTAHAPQRHRASPAGTWCHQHARTRTLRHTPRHGPHPRGHSAPVLGVRLAVEPHDVLALQRYAHVLYGEHHGYTLSLSPQQQPVGRGTNALRRTFKQSSSACSASPMRRMAASYASSTPCTQARQHNDTRSARHRRCNEQPTCDATKCNEMQRNATKCNATQRNATQRNATQRNATQRNHRSPPLHQRKQ
jgi:hypothetical protein